ETEGGEGAVAVTLATRMGTINAGLTIGADVTSALTLKAHEGISCPGVKLHGSGFIVTREEAAALGLGRIPGLEHHIREYCNGKDLTSRPRDVLVIDLFGLTEFEVRDRFPEVYQWVHERVKPERDAKAMTKDGAGYAQLWWLFGKPRQTLRASLHGLPRYIATVETSKHRFFQFLDDSMLPDNMLVCIAHDDAYVLGVLSSRIHVIWALATGAVLGPTPRYNKSRCFETFPFPDATEEQKARIRDLAERLDSHRKRQLALHPSLTMTDLYNVLETVRANETLTTKQRAIHEQGLITVLRQLHDELDAAVAAAYGWGEEVLKFESSKVLKLTDEEILERLVALNKQRADEESRGQIRYLRPAYQRPVAAPTQAVLAVPSPEPRTLNPEPSLSPLPWPESLADQIALVRGVIHQTGWQPADGAKILVRHFSGVRAPTVQRLVDALAALGHVG
ncbi:MAG: type IIL restriction-modification enzyme MmeI, partial [bacterium]